MQASGARTWLFLFTACVLAVGVVSCDSPTAPSPLVIVQPTGVVTLNVGDTLTVRAVVQNARPAVRFTSSNAAVATVDESTGLVRAVTAGEVTITATSVEVPDASASVEVHVQDTPSSVVIERILNAAGGLIDPTQVSGIVNVQLAVELGAAARLDVLVDADTACQQSFVTNAASTAEGLRVSAAALAGATITCPINTARFDAATGRPSFLNGPVTIRARLVGADGRTRSETAGFPITLANRDTLVATVTASKQATNASGLQWVDGNITVDVVPVIFNRGTSLKLAEFLYQAGGRLLLRVDTVSPFRGVFQEDSLANVTHDGMLIFIHTATTDGRPGPRLVAGPLRYDNQPPLPGAVTAREWIGAATPFADLYVPAPNGDLGVGGVHARFFAGDPILSDSALVGRGKLVATGADLQEGSSGFYRAAALVCDALENCILRPGFRFGVDLSPPTIEEITLRDRAINPGANLSVRVQDALSGTDALPVEAMVLSLDADPSTPECGPRVDGLDLPGDAGSGACVADKVGSLVPVPTTAAGYYTYLLSPLDRAGNRGTVVNRRILVDVAGPELTGLTVGGPYLPGDQGTFSATATDNLDLVDVVFRLVFPASGSTAGIALPFAADSAPLGVAFDGELTRQGARTSRSPVVRTLTTVTGATRSTAVVDSVQAQAVDAAGLTSTLSRSISLGGTIPALDPFATATTVHPAILDAGTVCTGGCLGTDRTTLGIRLRIEGSSALTQPFARVYYYRRDPATGTVTLLGSALSIEGVVGDGQASFTYPFTYTPTAGLTGAYGIFAVGVNSAGYALRSASTTATFFQR